MKIESDINGILIELDAELRALLKQPAEPEREQG